MFIFNKGLVTYQDLFSSAQAVTRWQRILSFSLSRIPVALVFLIPAILVQNIVYSLGKQHLSESTFAWFADGWTPVSILIFVASYRFYTKLVEKRPAHEFSITMAAPEFGVGVLAGSIPIIIIVGTMYLLDSYTVESLGDASSLVHSARYFAGAALLEELLFRIVLFRLLEEWIGSLQAAVLVAVLFGLSHAFNPGATIWTTTCLTLLGLPGAAAFLATRRIWLCWGSHMSWNYFQTAVFGMATSGVSYHSTFVTPQISGPDWLTGGSFGVEASALGVVLPTIVAGLFLIIAIRRGQIIKPCWKREQN